MIQYPLMTQCMWSHLQLSLIHILYVMIIILVTHYHDLSPFAQHWVFFLINMHNFYLVCYFYLRHNVFLSLFFLYFFLSRKNILNDCSRFIKYDHYVTSRKKELWNDHPPSFYFKCLFITICLPIIYYQNVPEWFSLLMIYLLTFKSEKGKVH